MSDFDNSILKRNVRALIKNNGMTQEQFSEKIGISQPNLSKALNPNDKKCFTVEQIYTIAEYFNVPIDWLVGRKMETNGCTPKVIATLLAKLLADKDASYMEFTKKEIVYKPFWTYDKDGNGYLDCKVDDDDYTYRAIYFPNFYDPSKIAKDPDEFAEYTCDAEQNGNETHYSYVNEFLNKYLQILPIFHDGKLSDDVFQNILNEFLASVPDK